ncbi:hypothetical protein FDP41_000018 [Naegleria fowleri]|uniref:Uncharacterized protein n=1 Tax=Naegleria fowleri TaxID=5763 RepID=A0A6A5CI62_NAEFO|nr:uncharacterized protein FDP41_000018 [Naegleria fowleri]KAF0984979.1 hypothetical protein FDP41_000018 [Naegleria fowleri]CAG4715068.1 unnamed protein product [Naegleria fowleri]
MSKTKAIVPPSTSKKKSSSSESVKKKKDTIPTPCLVQFTNSLSAPPNLQNIHFSLVKKDDDPTPFLFGESKSMQYTSSSSSTNSSSNKYLLAVVKSSNQKPSSIIEIPECFIVKEESKQNLQRKDILKRELEQGGADALQPDMTYQHFFEKRVIGGSEVADSLFNSKRYARLMQKRATSTTTSLKADQMENLKILVGRNNRSSSMATMRQYIPTLNIEAETVNDLFDLKTDLLFDDKHLIDHFKGKHCRNKSLQRVWKVLEGATMDNGALTEEANTSITSMTEFKNLPSFLQEYFGIIIQQGNWNAIAKKKRRRKKKSDDEDEEEGEKSSTAAAEKDDPFLPADELTEEQFSSFLQAIASDIPSLAQYYMIMLGIFQIAQARNVKDHVAAILSTCYVQGTLDKKAVQKIGKKEQSSRSSVKFTSMADIFPNPPIESMKTHPYLYLPKSSQTLQDLLLRLCVPEFTKSSPRHFQHLVFNQSVGKTLLIRTANHLLVAVLLMCNFYVKKEFIVALQKDTRLTVEKLLVCFNAMGVIPDSNQAFVHRTIRNLVRAASGADFASGPKTKLSLISTEGHGAHPAHVNFYLSLPKIKQLYGGKVAAEAASGSASTTSTKKREPTKKKESEDDLLVDEERPSKKKVNLDDDDDEVMKTKEPTKKSTSSNKAAEKTSTSKTTKPSKESTSSTTKKQSASVVEPTKPTKSSKQKEEDENIDDMSDEDDEDIENDLEGLLTAFQAQEDEDFEEDETEDRADQEDEDAEMAELVDEEEAERERPEVSDNEEELVENTLDEDEEGQDAIGALLDTLGNEDDLMDEVDENDEEDDDEVGVKEALSGKKKRKTMNDADEDEEAGIVKSNKKTKHDFEQDIEEGEDEESEEDEE